MFIKKASTLALTETKYYFQLNRIAVKTMQTKSNFRKIKEIKLISNI